MILRVSKGSTISSTEYNKENDGIAIIIKITAGIKVHTISNVAACTKWSDSPFFFVSLKAYKHVPIIITTKNKIKVKNTIKSS